MCLFISPCHSYNNFLFSKVLIQKSRNAMGVDDILRMDVEEKNEKDMVTNMGERHDHDGRNPWHNECEEAL